MTSLYGIVLTIVLGIVIFLLFRCFARYTQRKTETFNPNLDYTRAYPGTFSYRYGYGSFLRPFYQTERSNYDYWPGNISYNRPNADYWYIPAVEYLNRWFNGPDGLFVPDGCILPPITSEYCVKEQMQKTGNLDLSVMNCTVPATISDACPSLRNWQGPFTYANNDYVNISRVVS